MKKLQTICLTALPLLCLLCVPEGAWAQQEERSDESPADAEVREVAFSSDQLSYDSEADIVTASGDVRMSSEGNNLRADRLIWNRVSGEVRAEGKVRIVTPEGHVAYGDSIALTDTLRDGAVDNLLLVLEDGGRLAAERGIRKDGYTTLYRAAYSPCAVVGKDGCPKDPTWQITAVKVVHDPVRNRIRYQGASLNLFGMPIMSLPWLSHPDGTGGGGTGLLVPEIRISQSNGVELTAPYYFKFAPNMDATIAPHIYSDVLPALEGRFRHLTNKGAYQIGAFVTYSEHDSLHLPVTQGDRDIRAYLEGSGRFQLNPLWSVTASGRYVSDRTFLKRYDISRDTRLRSLVDLERIDRDSYISIAGWAFQGLRATDISGQQPIALPAIDARWRFVDPFWNGRIEVQANSLAILRTNGQDTQRAFAAAQWERRDITSFGQEFILTAYARGDLYHTRQSRLTDVISYRGKDGWHGRGIAAFAAEVRWPLVGRFLGGTQRLTPRAQIVISPPTQNLAIPNEDARAVDLEDSNLFALNRFPGYDRWEDGHRITYGVDWSVDLPGIAIRTTIGQSYRLTDKPSILPQGTGLSDRLSDLVGRTNVKFGRKLSLVHRFRLDKDNIAVRRNEADLVVGGRQTYATIGYLRLNRDIDPSNEDLRDREEIRVGGRIRFANYWSIFGSTVIDLTSRKEDPFSLADGYEPVRHRLGIGYDDDCIELGLTWRRDYETNGDFRRGNIFLFRVALKNLGR